MLEREDMLGDEAVHRAYEGEVKPLDTPEGPSRKVQRKASRRFPSKALGLQLPSFNVYTGLSSPLHGQNKEFVGLLRQSIARESKHTTHADEFGRKVLLDEEEVGEQELESDGLLARKLLRAEAMNKARMATPQGLGLWDSSPDGKARVREVAEWLKDTMR